jgi:hypothetical protein
MSSNFSSKRKVRVLCVDALTIRLVSTGTRNVSAHLFYTTRSPNSTYNPVLTILYQTEYLHAECSPQQDRMCNEQFGSTTSKTIKTEHRRAQHVDTYALQPATCASGCVTRSNTQRLRIHFLLYCRSASSPSVWSRQPSSESGIVGMPSAIPRDDVSSEA